MLFFNLKQPFDAAARVYKTKLHPLEAIITMADRSVGVMMVYSLDEERISYTVIAYDPATKKHITVEARTPLRAYELAQAEYQRDIKGSRSAR